MRRHRNIAAAPQRAASQTWGVISQLIVDTLGRSSSIAGSDVGAAMQAAAPAGIMLVAGGHLDRHPLVLVAEPVYLSVTTVSGDAANDLAENLSPVPGGGSASAWTLHMPTPDPLGDAVRAIVKGVAHLSAEDPQAHDETKTAAAEGDVIDLDALAGRDQSQ